MHRERRRPVLRQGGGSGNHDRAATIRHAHAKTDHRRRRPPLRNVQPRTQTTPQQRVRPTTLARRRHRDVGGCRAFGEVDAWDATHTVLPTWLVDAPLPADSWDKAKTIVTPVGKEFGFTNITLQIDDNQDYWLTDHYGAQLQFGSSKRTGFGITTGCHLYPEAKQRGTPRQD
ncbi:LppA family lipoprotein [Saccharomonospora sp. NPDC046836]|uniref:LppA family lipoprotein n=1 Tax=Saccharomonospora sp. NPDC046836 TaxID=3156921 RepID=UPI0033FC191B